MSESSFRVLYPFEIARRPSLEPEVRRAILARWSSNLGQAPCGTGRAANQTGDRRNQRPVRRHRQPSGSCPQWLESGR